MRILGSFALALLVLGCGDDGSGGSADDAAGGGSGDGGAMIDMGSTGLQIEGYWVWKQTVENGQPTLEVTEADMMWMVGSGGWPGCPDGISCTRHGINVLYIDADRFHHMRRVTTGSDYQMYGSYTRADDLVTVDRDQQYSCAHPRDPSTYPAPATLHARVKRMGEDLWITGLADADPGADAASWTVYRPITKQDAHNRYDHPYCGDQRKGQPCHCLCPSQDVLVDHTCAP